MCGATPFGLEQAPPQSRQAVGARPVGILQRAQLPIATLRLSLEQPFVIPLLAEAVLFEVAAPHALALDPLRVRAFVRDDRRMKARRAARGCRDRCGQGR